jgi:transposase
MNTGRASLCQKRRQCVDDTTRLSNQIKSELKGYYPLVLELLEGKTSTLLAADLLLRRPTLNALERAKADTRRRFFYLHNCRREEKIQARLQAIQSAVALTNDAAIIEPSSLRVLALAKQLKDLLPTIAQYDQQIEKLFHSHPDFELFDSLPGAGPALAPRLAAAFGTDRSRYHSATQFATFVGIAPIRITSDKSGRSCFRWACLKFLRQSLHEFAACSIKFCHWAAQFYQAFCQRNDNHHAAVRALAFKWIRILFRCWQQRVPYNEELYLRALKTRRSPYTLHLP